MLNINEPEESNLNIKQRVKDNSPQFCVHVGKSKNYVMRTQFSKNIIRSYKKDPYPRPPTRMSRKRTHQADRAKSDNKTG